MTSEAWARNRCDLIEGERGWEEAGRAGFMELPARDAARRYLT